LLLAVVGFVAVLAVGVGVLLNSISVPRHFEEEILLAMDDMSASTPVIRAETERGSSIFVCP